MKKKKKKRNIDNRSERDRRQFNFDWIPPDLHDAVKAKAQREGISVRTLVLAYLQAWVEPTARIKAGDIHRDVADTNGPRKILANGTSVPLTGAALKRARSIRTA